MIYKMASEMSEIFVDEIIREKRRKLNATYIWYVANGNRCYYFSHFSHESLCEIIGYTKKLGRYRKHAAIYLGEL